MARVRVGRLGLYLALALDSTVAIYTSLYFYVHSWPIIRILFIEPHDSISDKHLIIC